MTAPERIWVDWKRANAADAAYDEPPQSEYQDCRDDYILHTRAALAASPLVQEIVAEAVKAEREACADMVADHDLTAQEIERLGGWAKEWFAHSMDLAAAIRARGEGQPQEKGE